VFIFGAILMKIFIDLINQPIKQARFTVAEIGVVAGIFIFQGTILMLSGNWLP
jgi:hypothetical protein